MFQWLERLTSQHDVVDSNPTSSPEIVPSGLDVFVANTEGRNITHNGSASANNYPTLLFFPDWYPNEPNNNVGMEDCVIMERTRQWTWNDLYCLRRVYYICEQA